MNIRKMQRVLEIVSKYVNPERDYCEAQHDIIFLPLSSNTELTQEDEEILRDLGCHKSRDSDTWAIHT